ncbi:MAG: hypothetical protein JJT76_06505 [Clostridiaceae bacterium]|nr:hypothetical protein [Clostridiaceae bacterium]
MESLIITFDKERKIENIKVSDGEYEVKSKIIGENLINFVEVDIDKEGEKNSILLEIFLKKEGEEIINSINKVHMEFMKELQRIYKRKLHNVLDISNEKLHKLDRYKRLMYYKIKEKNYWEINEALIYKSNVHYSYYITSLLEDENEKYTPTIGSFADLQNELYDSDDSRLMELIEKIDINIYEEYEVYNIEEACEILFLKMIEYNVTVKICKNCKKLFIPSRLSDKYCSRIFEKNKTCSDVGYARKVNNHPILNTYKKVYSARNRELNVAKKRKNLSETTKKMYEEAFGNWTEKYSKLKEEYMDIFESLKSEEEKKDLEVAFKNEISITLKDLMQKR